jgi:hypothetical protein
MLQNKYKVTLFITSEPDTRWTSIQLTRMNYLNFVINTNTQEMKVLDLAAEKVYTSK